ncbi:MAG: hypothetical protein E7580_00190 [Ruminococcaceae bacterium]|nr:hypothetical protein [Oscillospiraceae bacterium]
MKRILFFVLAVVVLMTSLVSCSSALSEAGAAKTAEKQAESTKQEENAPKEKRDPTGFCAGYSRVVINPTSPVGMGGYGNTEFRRSTGVASDITAACTAVSDGENTALFFCIDVLAIGYKNVESIYRQVEKALGIKPEFITISATHSHSSPAISDTANESVANYLRIFYPAVLKAAKEAVADLDRCEMKIGRTTTTDLSYVRRYFREDGTFHGTNYVSDSKSPVVRHETEVDNEMQLLMFDRVNGKDILMMNWQCHVTTAGGRDNTMLSADWVGAMREKIEKDAGVHFTYHQGGAGNVVPNSFITTEPSNADYNVHGKKLADVALEAIPKMESVPTGKVRATTKTVTCQHDLDVSMYDLQKAQAIADPYRAGDYDMAKSLCLVYGYNSPYHANAVVNKSNRTEASSTMPLSAVAIGDIGFAVAPYEMFDTNGQQIKKNSTYTMTFVCAYSNGSYGYIPSEIAWPNGGYEVDTCKYVKGTGEMLANELVAMLTTLK